MRSKSIKTGSDNRCLCEQVQQLKKLMLMAILGMALCGCERKPDYEFHSGSDGQVLWRCNRKTGEVKIFTSYTDTVQMWRGASRDFIFNKQTGQIWRYYQNGTNSFPDEGFCPLDYGNPRSMESALGFVPDKIQHTNAIPDFKTLRGITNK